MVKKNGNGKASYLLLVRGKTDEEAREAPLSLEAYAAILAWRERCPSRSSFLFLALDGRGERLSARPMTLVAVWQTVQHYAAQFSVSAYCRAFNAITAGRVNAGHLRQGPASCFLPASRTFPVPLRATSPSGLVQPDSCWFAQEQADAKQHAGA